MFPTPIKAFVRSPTHVTNVTRGNALSLLYNHKYKHTLADGYLPEGSNVNHALAKDSSCW